MTDRPTDRPINKPTSKNRRTWGVIGKLHFQWSPEDVDMRVILRLRFTVREVKREGIGRQWRCSAFYIRILTRIYCVSLKLSSCLVLCNLRCTNNAINSRLIITDNLVVPHKRIIYFGLLALRVNWTQLILKSQIIHEADF